MKEMPGVVFHRRPEDAVPSAAATASPEQTPVQPVKPPSPTDLKSFRSKLTEGPAQTVAPVESSEDTIPIFWVILILLAFVGVAAYFLSTSSVF